VIPIENKIAVLGETFQPITPSEMLQIMIAKTIIASVKLG
jgi:hypothetical protein